MEEAGVELFKDSIEIVGAALGGMEVLASAHLPHQVSLPGDVLAGNIPAIAGGGFAFHRFAIHLREQDVGDGLQHRSRRTLQQVGQTHQELPSRIRMVFLML